MKADSKQNRKQDKAGTLRNIESSGVTSSELSEEAWAAKAEKADKVQTYAFQINRYLSMNKGESEKSLFDILRIQEEETKQSGAIITEPPRGVSLLTLKRINFALAKCLYNTSYREKNTAQNTGLIRDNITSDGAAMPPLEVEWHKKDKDGKEIKDSEDRSIVVKRKSYSYSEIEFSLTGLTKDVFGLPKGVKPTNQQKRIVTEALEAMQTGTKIILPNGDEITKSLLWIRARYKRASDKAIFYNSLLSPLYAMEIEQGAAAHPQDISQRMARLEKQTAADWDFLGLLGEQMGDKYKIHKRLLLQKLGLWEDYKKNKSRVNEKLSTLFDNMKSKGAEKLLDFAPDGSANPTETTGADGEIMYIFYFNPDYIPKRNKPIKTGEQEEA